MTLGWTNATFSQRVRFVLKNRLADSLFAFVFAAAFCVSFWCSVLSTAYLSRISRDTRELRDGCTGTCCGCSASNHPLQKVDL